jgi:hypothetical protein
LAKWANKLAFFETLHRFANLGPPAMGVIDQTTKWYDLVTAGANFCGLFDRLFTPI